MAFNDLLIVDDSSKASQESVLATCGFFTMKNGFISRDLKPDYGVDLNIELLINGNNPSGWEFPIQIKSQQNLNQVAHDRKQFISHSMFTSRLGCLCRRGPAYGLVVLYDDNTEICYYDYVEEIVKRTTTQHNGEDWKAQTSVNINIPTENILTLDEIKKIPFLLLSKIL